MCRGESHVNGKTVGVDEGQTRVQIKSEIKFNQLPKCASACQLSRIVAFTGQNHGRWGAGFTPHYCKQVDRPLPSLPCLSVNKMARDLRQYRIKGESQGRRLEIHQDTGPL